MSDTPGHGSTYAERLRWAMQRKQISQGGLAREISLHQQTIQYLADTTKTARGSKHTTAIAEALDINAHWLATGEGAPTALEAHQVIENMQQAEQAEMRRYTHHTNTPDTLDVPVFSARPSMGMGGELPDYDEVIGGMRLSKKWVQGNVPHISAFDNLAVLSAIGDSMSPTLESGDLLLIDTGIKTIKIDGVYVLSAHDRLYIKRVRQRMDGQYEVRSDNPRAGEPEVLNGGHQIDILGRVVWAWNGRRL